MCDTVYQVQSEGRGHCTECGLALLFSPEFPDLGECECGRKYTQADFNIRFCPKCGEPVLIDEDINTEHAKQSWIAKLLGEVPLLQNDGYLPSRIGLNN
jgi:NADH pyrophosphatase NudC (nudix superfamily)